ncbi:hypothetical protein, partial [Neisseria gonorrhoeae]|uniref:hypothetical protein n=1 Tax=Neisseria gonorrhoeae TaxID=485 RepID=UPI0016498099
FDEYVQTALKEVCAKAETVATRKASQNSIEILAKELPELVGGGEGFSICGRSLPLFLLK